MRKILVLLILLKTATFVSLAFLIQAGWQAFTGAPWWPLLGWVAATAVIFVLASSANRRAERLESDFKFGGLSSVTAQARELTAAFEVAEHEGAFRVFPRLGSYSQSRGAIVGQLAIGVLEFALALGGFLAVFIGAFFVPAGDWTLLSIGIVASLLGLPVMFFKRNTFTRVHLRRLGDAVLPPGHPPVPEALRRSFWAVAQIAVGRDSSLDGQVDRTEGMFQYLVLAWARDQQIGRI